jgi:hypothetical protein
MTRGWPSRRRSDVPEFVETRVNIDGVAAEIFSQYAGEQDVAIDGVSSKATFFEPAYCPDYRVMRLAGRLALCVNEHAVRERTLPDGIRPLRVTIREIMLAALLHDLGKHHEDCAPFLTLLRETDLRGDSSAEANRRKEYLLGLVRDVHCRKGPCMIDRLRDAGRTELHNPFIATTARRHGDDYAVNRASCWWSREINVITIADDYDAMTSEGPERAYKPRSILLDDAVRLLRAGAERGRYEPRLAQIFIEDVLRYDGESIGGSDAADPS